MKIEACILALLTSLVVPHSPTAKFSEAIVYHGYAKAGVIEVSIPVLYETEEPQVTIEPVVNQEQTPEPVQFNLTDPYVGQIIAGYRVSSLQGPRRSPCAGCSSHHNGLDVATPIGTPLYAPGKIEVVCKVDSGGGGHYAEFLFADMLWQSLHLKANSCKPGGYEKGWKFAETGNTGRGTGAHLHLQLRIPSNRSFVKVKTGHAEAILIQQRN